MLDGTGAGAVAEARPFRGRSDEERPNVGTTQWCFIAELVDVGLLVAGFFRRCGPVLLRDLSDP